MRTLLTLILVLLSLIVCAQSFPADTSSPSRSNSVHLIQLSELDYYKQLAKQAQEQSDRAHEDVKWNYSLSSSLVIGVFAILLVIQFFNYKKYIKNMRLNILQSLDEKKTEINTQVNAANISQLALLERANLGNLDLLENRLNQITNSLDNRINTVLSEIRQQSQFAQVMQSAENVYSSNDVTIDAQQKSKIGEDSTQINSLVRLVINSIGISQNGSRENISNDLDKLEEALKDIIDLDNGAYKRIFDIFSPLSMRKSEFPQLDRIHNLMSKINRVIINYNDTHSMKKIIITRGK